MNLSKAVITGLASLTALAGASAASAYAAPDLGSAARYTVLSIEADSRGAVTCTDSTVAGIVGSSGARPAVVETRCSISGGVVAPVALRVGADANAAYTALNNNACQAILTGTQAGAILSPGVYCFDAAAALTGTLTLNGPSTGVWIFLVNGDLTGQDFSMVMAGGSLACNVYWAADGATTMTTSNAKGTIIAAQAITLTGGSFAGRAIAGKGATLTNIAATACAPTVRSPRPRPRPRPGS
jgi:hypothetical protein